MTDDEYRAFLAFLFERYVRPRIGRVRRRFHHHMMEEWYYHLDQAERAAHVLRYIEDHCDEHDEAYRTFTAERLQRAVADTHSALSFNNRIIEEAGFLDAYEAHARDILRGLRASHLPEVDREVLREMGSPNAAMEAKALVMRAKASLDRSEQISREVSVRQQLRQVEERLTEAERQFDQRKKAQEQGEGDSDAPKKSRRWFKGLGQICQGAAISIANVALAVGALHFPVSPETQTWGAVASVSTGIGTILSGMGDLRNE